jgi:hypothetical protein
MDESSTNADCELEFIGRGYDPLAAVEICASEEGGPPEGDTEESSEDKGWERR